MGNGIIIFVSIISSLFVFWFIRFKEKYDKTKGEFNIKIDSGLKIYETLKSGTQEQTNTKVVEKSFDSIFCSKKEIVESANETINNVDKMLNEYGVDDFKIIKNDTESSTKYILTGINSTFNRDFLRRFVLAVSDEDKENSNLHIMFSNQIGKTNPISLEIIPFEHPLENFYLLEEPIKDIKDGKYEYIFAISFNGKVPYWEKTYMYSFPEQFPNNEISAFYYVFKREFFNGNYIDLKGVNNYAFCLMFDILKNNNETIQKYLPILAEKYLFLSQHVKHELGKRGMFTKTYNGRVYYLLPNNVYCVKEDFNNKEQILHWLTESGEFSTTGMAPFVNENGVIDVVIDESLKLYGNEKRHCKVLPIANRLPEYIKFGIVEGNFYYTNTGWNSVKNKESGYLGGQIESHDIETLEGCPDIVRGMFRCEKLGLTSLNGCPKKVDGDFIAKSNKLSSFVGMPKYIGGCFNIANNELDDSSWEYAKENIEGEFGDYNISKNKFIKYRKELY